MVAKFFQPLQTLIASATNSEPEEASKEHIIHAFLGRKWKDAFGSVAPQSTAQDAEWHCRCHFVAVSARWLGTRRIIGTTTRPRLHSKWSRNPPRVG